MNGHAAGKRLAGVLAPLCSVRTAAGGDGDFLAAERLVDWCRAAGLGLLQFLPHNTLTPPFFSPYQATSSFALDPLWLDLGRITGAPAAGTAPAAGGGPQRFDYRRRAARLDTLRGHFAATAPRDPALAAFREENAAWLEDFVLFEALRRRFGNRPWTRWPAAARNREPAALERFRAEEKAECAFQAWLQWLARDQARALRAYARARGVRLTGDLPALVSGDSADVWAHRELFKLDFEAGAPPDAFSPEGQRWGMPPCDWAAIAADDYRYPVARLRYAAQFYDFIRIDHVIGLFRLWTIPAGGRPREGFFDPPGEESWGERGRRILRVLADAAPVQLCAEDLGVIPAACPRVLAELDIPGLEVLRWARDWDGDRRLRDPAAWRENAVAVLSTHDTSNFAAWWQAEATAAEKDELNGWFAAGGRPHPADPAAVTAAGLAMCLGSRSRYSIQLVFDWLAADGRFLPGEPGAWRVNTPGTTGPANWSTLIPRPLEDWPGHPVTRQIRQLVADAGRG